jgi:hypothetical protein
MEERNEQLNNHRQIVQQVARRTAPTSINGGTVSMSTK